MGVRSKVIKPLTYVYFLSDDLDTTLFYELSYGTRGHSDTNHEQYASHYSENGSAKLLVDSLSLSPHRPYGSFRLASRKLVYLP